MTTASKVLAATDKTIHIIYTFLTEIDSYYIATYSRYNNEMNEY